MGRYKKSEREVRMSSEGYLSHLDQKLGMPVGTIYSLCKAAVSGKSIERKECRVTYKGLTSKSVRVSGGQFNWVPKRIFLIEGNETNEGRKVLAQVFLSMPDTQQSYSSLVPSPMMTDLSGKIGEVEPK